MVKAEAKNKEAACAVIAMNNRGEVGAASMNAQFHLQYALWKSGIGQMLESRNVY